MFWDFCVEKKLNLTALIKTLDSDLVCSSGLSGFWHILDLTNLNTWSKDYQNFFGEFVYWKFIILCHIKTAIKLFIIIIFKITSL